MSNISSKRGKLARYRALKIKEKARILAEAEGIEYENALVVFEEKETKNKLRLLKKPESVN